MKAKPLAWLLAVPLLLAVATAAAVPTPKVISHGIPHQALFDVAFVGPQGYAVGAGGEILATADGGKTWVREKSPTSQALLGVAVRDKLAVVVGQMGTILVKDGKRPWTRVPVETKERLMAVAIRGNVVVAVGAFGTVLRSTDRGKIWVKAGPDWPPMFTADQAMLGPVFHPHLYVCAFDQRGNLFVAGEIGTIIKSTDEGRTWAVVHKGTATANAITASVFGLSITARGVGVAVGQTGSILRTTDDGASWIPVKSGTSALLLGALAKDNGQVLVTGMYAMLWSTDGGQTWQPVTAKHGLIVSNWYSDVAGNPDTIGDIVVGQGNAILSVKP